MALRAEILTTRQVADRFAVHPATVVKWAESGVLACFRTPGGHRRYRLEDVERLLSEGVTYLNSA